MRKRWMSKAALMLAGLLVICLFFNNFIKGIPVQLYASEEMSALTVTSGDAEELVAAEASEGSVLLEGVQEAVESPLPEGVQINLETTVVADSSESIVAEDVVDVAVLTADDSTTGTHLPTTAEEYSTEVANGTKTFYITTYEQFLAMQDLCDTAAGFKDITLVIATPPEAGGIWNIAGQTGFMGIGTVTNPFQGTLYCGYDTGVQLQMATPLFAYLGEGANVYKLDMVSNGGSAMIADTIAGNVTISNMKLAGAVSNTSGAAGIIAANLQDGSNVTLSGITQTNTISVTGSIAGGLAGVVGNGATITLGDGIALGSSDARIVVTGTDAAGGHFGTVTGSSTWDFAEESKLFTAVVANASTCYAGQYAGKLLGTADVPGQLNITDSNNGYSVTVDVSGTGNGGGLVGLCGSNTTITKPENGDGAESTVTIAGTVSMTGGYAGGVIGEINATNMELRSYTVTADVSGAYAGGIVGGIITSKDIIADVTVSGGVCGATKTGGIMGQVINASAVELQGTIDVLNINLVGAKAIGTVLGEQNVSLVYFAESEGEIDGVSQFQRPLVDGTDVPKYMEVNTYGGIFRNQIMTSGNKLIGDGTLANVGVVNNSIVQTDGWYQLGEDSGTDATADLETLAIALYTDGKYGLSAFSGAASYSELLKGSYTLNNNADIFYGKTGIITINRPDKDTAQYAFAGKLKGVNENITITQDIRLYQYHSWYLGLFRTLGGDAEFSNLIIDGTVKLATNVGGLAYQTIGTSLTLTNIQMRKAFVDCNNDTTYNYGVGGFLVKANNTTTSAPFQLNATNLTLASTYSSTLEKFSSFIVEMNNAVVNIDTVKIGGSLAGTRDNAGGFLGNAWSDTGGTIKNVSVLDTGATYTASGKFGTLFHTVSTKDIRLILDTVNLTGLTVNMSGQKYCGLLINTGMDAVIEVIDYDCSGCVINNPGIYFDEIVAKNKVNSELGVNSGILSIHKRPDSNAGDTSAYCFPEYHYEYQIESLRGMRNPYTMYFYDVFQRLDAEGITIDTTLDTETEVLLWDILHYARKGNVWNYFNKYWGDAKYSTYNDIYWEEQFSFAGNLNLSTISFYPVTRVGGVYECNDAVISFNAAQMQDWEELAQHSLLSAGLFMDTENMTIRNLTLTGNVANEGAMSGALVCGSSGLKDGWIYNITLDDLWIYDYSASQEEPGAGLLISNVPGAAYGESEEEEEIECDEVNFYYITMTGYEDAGDKKAAAALIGSAGGENVNNLILNFKYMKIADDRDDRTDGSHNGKVLAYASFLYNYNYTNDAKINEGYGLYLFSESHFNRDDVTLGEELDFDTEFSDNSNTVFNPDEDPAPSTLYKPYVYQVKDIEVNPKSGDILKGCGTYEDPYIIETAKQFLTLYRYMNETGTVGNYQYETFYDGWQVIKIGDDSTFCATKHSVTENADGSFIGDGADAVVTYEAEGENADFPTPDEMSRAYYRLGEDIDLSVDMSTTYAQIAQDFVGFGTEERPFVGVWYGKDADGTIRTITLPDKTNTDPYATYGFIQYAKGAVVKDMIIKTSEAEVPTTTTSIRAQIKEMGGGVIACILGGDNIIDNVTVAVEYKVADENAIIGGYVGNVQKGGLILRNVSEGAAATEDTSADIGSLAGFTLDQTANQTVIVNGASQNIYEHLGAVVGKVEDGYVLYEGSAEEEVLWSGTGGNTVYEQVPAYNILNGDTLKTNASGIIIEKTEDSENGVGNITITIPTTEALQVMSMALNADALNVRPSDYSENGFVYDICGYTELSRSRKAAYSEIGCTDATTADYVLAAKYDNVMNYTQDSYTNADKAYAYPYLYQYMGITEEEYLGYLVGTYSVLNPYSAIGGINYLVQWNLQENQTYDMASFGTSFRGLGALYGTNVEFGGTFRGNFDGKGSTIHISMIRTLLGHDKTNTAVTRAGVFNVLYGRNSSLYSVPVDFKDIWDTEAKIINCAEIKNFTLTGEIHANTNSLNFNVGGIAGRINSGDVRFNFENIVIRDFKIHGYSVGSGVTTAGGIVGTIGSNTNIRINNCHIQGTEGVPVELKGRNNLGGFVGLTDSTILKFVDSSVEYLSVEAGYDNAGGFVAWASDQVQKIICEGTEGNYCSVKNSTLNGNSRAGGLVAGALCPISIQNALTENTTLNAYNYMGGIVGVATGAHTSKINQASVTNITAWEEWNYDGQLGGIGGIIGNNQQNMTVQNATVTGTLDSTDAYKCKLHAVERARTNASGSGGIVGAHLTRTLTLQNCSVDTVLIEADNHATWTYEGNAYNVSAGGIVGYVNAAIILDGDIQAKNLKIVAPLRSEITSEASSNSVTAAGGCFGLVKGVSNPTYTYIIATEANTPFAGLTATNNTVIGKQAGGLIGYVSEQNTGVRLTGIKVENGTVTSDEIAGGVYGYIAPGFKGTVLENTATNYVTNMQISGRMAGGVIGELTIFGDMRMESLKLEDNSVIAKQNIDGAAYGAGGVIGNCCGLHTNPFRMYDVKLYNNIIACETDAAILAEGEVDTLAAGGLIGRTYQSTSESIAEIECDNIVIDSTNKIGVRQTGTTDVMLVTYDSENEQYKLAVPTVTVPAEDAEYKHYEALQDLTVDYGYYVGNFVGVWDSDQLALYILRSNAAEPKFTPPALTINPPVTDVGRNSTQTADAYRSDCHIIYGATVTDAAVANTADADAGTNVKDMKAQVDAVNATYADTDTLSGILQEYRLSQQSVDWFGKLYQDTFTFSEGKTIGFPVLVYKAEYGTLQEIMECVTDVMTNLAGASSSDLPAEYLSITCKQMLCDGTTVVEGTEVASITAVTTNGVTTYSSSQYDGIVDDKVSYTEITFVYGWAGHTKTFKLPIFVEEPILYGVHSILMEGRVTDVETIKQKGIAETDTEIIMANDSDYTMLLEYTYGKARKNMPDDTCVDKVFYLEANGSAKAIAVGTKLMLIDVTNGNRVYYYTVESNDITQIKFTDFKDSAGNAYVNKSINKISDVVDEGEAFYTDLSGHQLEEIGVESFLLTVLAPDTAGGTNELYTINASIDIADEGLATRFDTLEEHEEQTQYGVKSIPGLVISFVNEGTDTDIEGTVSKEGGLTIKAAISLSAKDGLYWAEKRQTGENSSHMIDSSNNGKYLDLAFYLRDLSGNRVNFPSGTNFSYKVGEGISSEKKVISNNSVIYYYKDIRDVFGVQNSEYQIGNILQDTTINLEFYLDFSGADFSNIAEEKYDAWLDLLRTSNKEYPMGNDNKLDDYTEEVDANASQQMGFAIRAKDLYELAINTYPEASETNTINYNVMFDFSDILKQTTGAGTNALIQKWSNFDYTVTYQIYRKTQNGERVTYEPYTGNDIVLTATGSVTTDDQPVSVTSTNGSATALYRFTEDELSENEGLMSFPGTITINTKTLTGDLTNLTNYKVQATLVITERNSTTQPAEETIDFFIYTITRLKMDL